MSSASIAAGKKANRRAERLGVRNPPHVRAVAAIINRARGLWQSKIAVELAMRSGSTVRAAENWLAGDRSPSAGALVALFQSEEGFEFFEAMVSTMPTAAQQRWRDEFDRAALRASFKARQDALAAEIAAANLGVRDA